MAVADDYSASVAREVLARCEYLLQELRNKPTGIEWEAKFSAAVALLRSVGHVLKDVDAKKNAHLDKAQKKWWKSMKSEKESQKSKIFWKFIDEDRNLILHEGELRAGQSATITLQGAAASAVAAGQQVSPSLPPQNPPAPDIYHDMNEESPFYGRNAHDLVEEAILWWRQELESIETTARTNPS